MTSLANPRSALSVASVFAVALPAQPSLPIGVAAATLMVAISVGWYICVVYMFATGIVANSYQRLRRWIDGIAGGLLILFGVRLALDRGDRAEPADRPSGPCEPNSYRSRWPVAGSNRKARAGSKPVVNSESSRSPRAFFCSMISGDSSAERA